jgi:thioredoxin-like negative regulator of GroEL
MYSYVRNDPVNSVDPMGWADNSVNAAIRQAAARGDLAELETILEATTGNKAAQAAAQAAINRLKSRAADIIARECKGSINREFPGELLEKTLEEILKLARGGDKAAQTARKLLSDLRFKK